MRKYIGSAIAGAVGIFYFISNQFISTEHMARFEHDSVVYDLYVDYHPDKSVYAYLYNPAVDETFAVTKWFRPKGTVSAECTTLNACYVISATDSQTGARSGWKLTADALNEAVSASVLANDLTSGFEEFNGETLVVAALPTETGPVLEAALTPSIRD